MNIIYASSYIERKYFYSLFSEREFMPGQQVQKYHHLLVNGLKKNFNVHIKVISSLPINSLNYDKRIISSNKIYSGNLTYKHFFTFNIKFIKNISDFLNGFFEVIFVKKELDTVVIADVLHISVTAGALLACKLRGILAVGIVTDLPRNLSENNASIKINNKIASFFDSYLFLTKAMNTVINKYNKPYLVLEGHVDSEMDSVDNILDDKENVKVCIYAGNKKKIYGIECLVKSFIKADVKDSELHIYGDGDFKTELLRYVGIYSNIKYFGVVDNDCVVEAEIKATLLINPRPSHDEYTWYSFPSKNMEYMVSGTPVLTTKLPGMPKDYYDYVYLIETETVEGMSRTISSLLNKSKEELHQFGMKAKAFVLNEKNNVNQAGKVIGLIKDSLYAN